VVLKVIAGMTGTLPKVGDDPIFSVYTTSWVPPAALPRETPWTHVAERTRLTGSNWMTHRLATSRSRSEVPHERGRALRRAGNGCGRRGGR
jgi:hypothetical protein